MIFNRAQGKYIISIMLGYDGIDIIVKTLFSLCSNYSQINTKGEF